MTHTHFRNLRLLVNTSVIFSDKALGESTSERYVLVWQILKRFSSWWNSDDNTSKYSYDKSIAMTNYADTSEDQNDKSCSLGALKLSCKNKNVIKNAFYVFEIPVADRLNVTFWKRPWGCFRRMFRAFSVLLGQWILHVRCKKTAKRRRSDFPCVKKHFKGLLIKYTGAHSLAITWQTELSLGHFV